MMYSKGYWTNPSVLKFAGSNSDPVAAIIETAQSVVLKAIDDGWKGPPFDPLMLADLLRIEIIARQDVVDARTTPAKNNRFLIEFNPNRPKARIRYSIAHEIAHTFFPDCHEQVRRRSALHENKDDWQ